MEQVIDLLIGELSTMNETLAADGGIADTLPLSAIYFGDPGIIPATLFPCATIEPILDSPVDSTTGYDKRDLRIRISLHIDARQYFDSTADEAMGDRMLVQATYAVTRWFQRRSKRTLDGNVMNVSVGDTEYRVAERGSVTSKSSRTTLLVRKTYARVLD